MAILRPGHNCWRIEQADRLAVLVDGDIYFRAVRAACQRARHSIWALCWDIDSRVSMLREAKADGYPVELGKFFRAVLARRRGLHAYILTWDFHLLYAFEREWWPWFPFRFGSHRRLHFHMDDLHPVGACHHQKIIVFDDQLAILGGLDPTKNRWDTPEHRAHDRRRMDPDVGEYPPFHDVQVMVEGPVAAALGELARDRWHRATGERIPSNKSVLKTDVWPSDIAPDLLSVPVALVRTHPRYNGEKEVREVETLFLDTIRACRRDLYIESQYLTSDSVAQALVARLQEARGPDIVVIVHPNSSGWVEQHTMDVLRVRVLRRLRAADRHGRLGVYSADIPGLGEGCMTMHSKVMIMDDELARIGSANLSNRSMGFDTECDLALEANGDSRIQAAIADLRHRLLGEHLGVDPAKVADGLAKSGSLLKTVEHLRGTGRTLKVFDHASDEKVDALVPDATLVDPDRPLDSDEVVTQVIPCEQRASARHHIIIVAGLLLSLFALAAAWRWTPLQDWLNAPELAGALADLKDSPAAPFIVLGGYVIGGVAVVPVTVLIALTVLTFGPWLGFLYSLAGSVLSAAAIFALGHVLGNRWVCRLAGTRVNRLSQQLAKRGVLAIMAVRVIPVAPFTVVNLVAGASHVRFRDFLIGTIIGMVPGLVGMTIFMDRLVAALQHPEPIHFTVMAVGIGIILLGTIGLRRWLQKCKRRETPSGTA